MSVNQPESSRDMVDIQCDCKKKEITITWHAVVSDSISDDDIKKMKELLEAYWKPPSEGYKYGECTVSFVFDLVRKGALKPADLKKYDEIKPKGAGGGDTTGPDRPDAKHTLYLSSPNDVVHEFGHCLGFRDRLMDDGTGHKEWKHWDDGLPPVAGNGLVGWTIWHAPGKEQEAQCCKPKNGYFMDHEVGVTVTTEPPSDPKKDYLLVNVVATSLAHEIDYIRVWGQDGKQVGDDISKLERSRSSSVADPKGLTPDPAVKDKSEWPYRADKHFIHVPKDAFPICVDVFEKAGAKEGADAHRHGWFGKDGKPVEADGHLIEKYRESAYYPALPGGKSGPGAYQKP
jgi:hypothetical protein